MPQNSLAMLAALIVLGALAHWVAWALRLPSILLLLLGGFLAGPIAGVIQPTALFGDLLLPFVSLSVALILFEGGLSLNVRELRHVGAIVLRLVTLGALTTWALAAAAAHWLIGLDLGLSVLLGAILTVTGPTVVLPLLQHIRPAARVDAILKWEGIVIDPIGAVLAVIAFELIGEGRFENAAAHAAWTISRTLILGGALGAAGAGLFVLAIRRFWIPDHLHALLAATLVIAVFTGSNWLLHESGLMAVTTLGIVLANQRLADVRNILEFKENLRVFLLSAVFILLSARLQLADLATVGLGTLAFLLVLIVAIRPAAVLVSTLGSRLAWRERAVVAWMAPRGIVAAAVTSVFALALEQRGYAAARLLVPIVFSIIVGTVLVYGLTSGLVARRLRVADPDPQGLLIVGAGAFARQLARAVQAAGFRVLLVDSNRDNIAAAVRGGLPTHFGSILAEDTLEKIDLGGIGRLLAMTSNDEVNTLAVHRFVHRFGRANLFQLAPRGSESGQSKIAARFHGRLLFRADATLDHVEALLAAGAAVRTTTVTPDAPERAAGQTSDPPGVRTRSGPDGLPLILLPAPGRLVVIAAEERVEARVGHTVITLSQSLPKEPLGALAPAAALPTAVPDAERAGRPAGVPPMPPSVARLGAATV